MSKEVQTYVLLVGLAISLTILVMGAGTYHLPGNHQGYQPDQPIAYSHRLHAGELGINCRYCHYGADKSKHAGVPAASVCMNCHKFVTATLGALQEEDKLAKKENRPPKLVVSPELQKLYDALGLDENREPDPNKKPKNIEWVKIHNLPDFVYFDHRPHVNAGLECQKCHGNIETMVEVKQVESLAMGWCVNCHRRSKEIGVAGKPVDPKTDCTTCHY